MDTTLTLFDELFVDDPDRLAVVSGERQWSYGEMAAAIEATADALRSAGAETGMRIGMTGLSAVDYLFTMYACASVGVTAVPAMGRDTERNDALLEAAGVDFVVDADGAVAAGPGGAPRDPAIAMILHTSGTTSGGRKGVLLSHRAIATTVRDMNAAMELTPDVREVVFAPLDHAFGFGRCHCVLSIGGTVMLSQGLRLSDLFTWLEEGATSLATTPSTLAALLLRRSEEFAKAGHALRWMQTGAMRFDVALRNQLCDLLPSVNIFVHYGLSEAMRSTFMNMQAHPDKRHTEGPAAASAEIAILDPSTRAQLPQGSSGQVAIRGGHLCSGYTDRALWEQSLHEDWYVTSDLGMLDDDGFLVFQGRVDDVINANGNIVHPDEIEGRLVELLPPGEYCVFGLPDPRGVRDTVVALAVVAPNETTVKAVRDEMKGAPDFMIPQQVFTIDALPRTDTGKVVRAKLPDLCAEQAS